ncbi:hypothetical protein SP90_09150 [Halodesulfovibrio spirochaetisodalis]|uniref:Uncharacterized protein n=1 Tax=Halodesulfovibrio spirochaetisodalis TaxID=1560234 RepID=A0A1B7XCU6_9BACT|nr:hypothetical protein SP90_09150 [Halodesulfovibrio spirochaetisodalis]
MHRTSLAATEQPKQGATAAVHFQITTQNKKTTSSKKKMKKEVDSRREIRQNAFRTSEDNWSFVVALKLFDN